MLKSPIQGGVQFIEGKEEDLGLTLKKRQSRRIAAHSLTDLDFADDLALLSNLVEEAQELLNRVEIEVSDILSTERKLK